MMMRMVLVLLMLMLMMMVAAHRVVVLHRARPSTLDASH